MWHIKEIIRGFVSVYRSLKKRVLPLNVQDFIFDFYQIKISTQIF